MVRRLAIALIVSKPVFDKCCRQALSKVILCLHRSARPMTMRMEEIKDTTTLYPQVETQLKRDLLSLVLHNMSKSVEAESISTSVRPPFCV